MRPAEEEIIQYIPALLEPSVRYADMSVMKDKLERLFKEPFCTTSPEFRNHPFLRAFIEKAYQHSTDEENYIMLYFSIEDYLSNKENSDLVQEKFNLVEAALKNCLEKITPETKKQGTAMLPTTITNAHFMRILYSLNDENLSCLFSNYLPVPRATVFAGQGVPEIIQRREQAATTTVINVLERNDNDLIAVENKLIAIQRIFRAQQRRRENLQRLPVVYSNLWRGPDQPRGMTPQEVEQLLTDANTPYQPHCDARLAERIMNAAKKVELFSTVRHLTASSALTSIFNDGFLGRRSMIQFYMPFKPACLAGKDIENGDANVICLGANRIDQRAKHGVELLFDAKKLTEKNNPCVFYKQKDLEYCYERSRRVSINDLDLVFIHTYTDGWVRPGTSPLRFISPKFVQSAVTKALLIADNLEEMHRILTLNFFRFIDLLIDSGVPESACKKIIYEAFSNLTDQQLEETLLQIGKQMTDTMEFNFYGAYRIDFSALLTIKKEEPSYSLDLREFVDALKIGNITKLHEAIEKIPEIFDSYRFVDYLLSTVVGPNNVASSETVASDVIVELKAQRARCIVSSWMEPRSTVVDSTSFAASGVSSPSSAPHATLFKLAEVDEKEARPKLGGEYTSP